MRLLGCIQLLHGTGVPEFPWYRCQEKSGTSLMYSPWTCSETRPTTYLVKNRNYTIVYDILHSFFEKYYSYEVDTSERHSQDFTLINKSNFSIFKHHYTIKI